MKFTSCRFANAVKVGNAEHLFLRGDSHDIDLVSDTVVRIKEKKSGAVAYSSLFNVPFWTMDEKELNLEAEGIPPAENLDIAAPKKKAPQPKKATA